MGYLCSPRRKLAASATLSNIQQNGKLLSMLRVNPWLLGGAVVVGVLLLTKSARAALAPTPYIPGASTASDVEALARMLIVETGLNMSQEEMAQIAFVAINRARRNNRSIPEVVTPPGRPNWNSSSTYARLFKAADSTPVWTKAKVFARRVLNGEFPNKGYRNFVHPEHMSGPPCFGRPVLTNTKYGWRCVPPEVAQGTQIDKTLFG